MVTGGSYGGYMTLAVGDHYTDRIRCAIDVVGISNFVTFLENTEGYRRDLRRVEYGDERDPEMRAFLRPDLAAEQRREDHEAAVRRPGRERPARAATPRPSRWWPPSSGTPGPVWYLLAKDEGHGFAKKANADFQFYATVQFIRAYLLSGEGMRP